MRLPGALVSLLALIVIGAGPIAHPAGADGDLDAFMQRVLSRRDDNWKKLRQYVLDEHESLAVRGPSGAPIWGEQRDYTWFIRDGFFIRSPLRANGVTITEDERRQYEAQFLESERARERRFAQGRIEPPNPASAAANPPDGNAPTDAGALVQQTRAPRFVSSAYFLRFQFESDKYALVGTEMLDGRDVYRVEYYPSKLFPQNRRGPGRLGSNPVDTETRRLLNKVALVTLWIDPASAQIVKYTFDNVALDFLPAQWLVRVNGVSASMSMDEPFPDVWLPRGIDINVELGLATGDASVRYQLAYHDYRRADASSIMRVPPER